MLACVLVITKITNSVRRFTSICFNFLMYCFRVLGLGMISPDVIDLSSDEEIEEANANDVKPFSSANNLLKSEEYAIKLEIEERRSSNSCSCVSEQGSSSANGVPSPPGSPGSPVPLVRQFWKSGDYEPGQAFAQVSQSI